MRSQRYAVLALGVLMLGWGRASDALSPADKCEASKNKIAGKYAFCRQKAEAKAIKVGSAPDYSKCDAKLSLKWMAAESSGGGMCPTNSDEAAMQGFIITHANAVATALSGAGFPSCDDGTINTAGEQCDGSDLGGASCVTLGFIGGTLACSACAFDTSGCTCSGMVGLPETGQTQCDQGAGTIGACPGSPSGQDGSVRAGLARSYTDNGNGTITDNVTGLMWEKLSNDGSIHDINHSYSWSTAVTTKIAALNGSGFAGHTDWRVPNEVELESLVDFDRINPSIDPIFNTSCPLGCTVTTCSCMLANDYWSSTSYQLDPINAWTVHFNIGEQFADPKTGFNQVRAVRGGS